MVQCCIIYQKIHKNVYNAKIDGGHLANGPTFKKNKMADKMAAELQFCSCLASGIVKEGLFSIKMFIKICAR